MRSLLLRLLAAGIHAGTGYFAPNVPETHDLVFELHFADGRTDFERPAVSGVEARLRVTSLIEEIGRTDHERWRRELVRRLARSTWERHPDVVTIRAFLSSVSLPTMAAYRAGNRQRIFTLLHTYEFERVAVKDRAPDS